MLEVVVTLTWIMAVYLWQRRRVRLIRAEGERLRSELHAIYDDLKQCLRRRYE